LNVKTLAALALAAIAGTASAQVVDGTRDSSYVNVWSQNVQTGFGDNSGELNNLGITSGPGGIYLFLGGNLETNGNDFEIFFDTGAPGQNTMGGAPGSFGNVQFTHDAAFTASRWISVNRAGDGNTYVDSLVLNGTQTAWTTSFEGTWNGGSSSWSGAGGAYGVIAGYNDANTGGVTGGNGAASQAAAAAVSTGLELFIPWSALGLTNGSTFRIAGFQNGGNHDYASNQFLGGFATLPQGNLGGDGNGAFIGGPVNFDLNDFDGDQFVTVPGPSAAALLGLAALGAGRRRR
jgi:hypothetical protein